ncbi:hypothetical protein [Undibacterium sp. TS12]|uniref:hypothetical protein n=1 Tax=Undibacterium sp. TS12 TaxID=2908202 RepID=UPI001F4CC782|nr:hypothetical protein [Undibacterium sp. TS12]MCH8622277.1 hypothetical protein [Undibacterium sp. TS12]
MNLTKHKAYPTIARLALWGLVTSVFIIVVCFNYLRPTEMQVHKHLMSNIAWSFSEPPPSSPELLVEAVGQYSKDIHFAFERHFLTDITPYRQLDIVYQYSVQQPDSNWLDVKAVVAIGDGSHQLSNAEILWSLHRQAYAHLKDEDHHYFEGLWALKNNIRPGVPAFEVDLGS